MEIQRRRRYQLMFISVWNIRGTLRWMYKTDTRIDPDKVDWNVSLHFIAAATVINESHGFFYSTAIIIIYFCRPLQYFDTERKIYYHKCQLFLHLTNASIIYEV